jgi:hypothetical protein
VVHYTITSKHKKYTFKNNCLIPCSGKSYPFLAVGIV